MEVEFQVKHPTDTRDGDRWGVRLEVIITVLLGVAAVVAAYAIFRSEQLSSESNHVLYVGQLAETQFVANTEQRSAEQTIDQTQFLLWRQAVASQNYALAYEIQRLMSPNLQKAVASYAPAPALALTGPPDDLAQARELNQSLSGATNTPSANTLSPLSSKEYVHGIGDVEGDKELLRHANEYSHEGLELSHRAERFSQVEIFIAMALFLYGIAAVSRRMKIKLGALALGACTFSLAVVLLALA
jgi:hypothetical protein